MPWRSGMVTQETSTEKSSRTGSPRSRPWLSPRVADGYGSTRAAILFSEAFKARRSALESAGGFMNSNDAMIRLMKYDDSRGDDSTGS
eukprot:symbB.v1.2.003703.t1/scaffold209.1/size267950/1